MSKEFVKSVISDNNIGAEKAFNDSISAKVGQALEASRKEISRNIVSTKTLAAVNAATNVEMVETD